MRANTEEEYTPATESVRVGGRRAGRTTEALTQALARIAELEAENEQLRQAKNEFRDLWMESGETRRLLQAQLDEQASARVEHDSQVRREALKEAVAAVRSGSDDEEQWSDAWWGYKKSEAAIEALADGVGVSSVEGDAKLSGNSVVGEETKHV